MKRVLLLFLCLTILSCSKKAEVHTDVAGLAQFINLPATPVSVQWVYWNSGEGHWIELGPTDYSITAVVKLNESDFKKLKEQYANGEPHENQLFKGFVEEWFPQSVKDCFTDKGEYVSIAAWNDPEEFTKSPLLYGYLFFTDNNEVFVRMDTM